MILPLLLRSLLSRPSSEPAPDVAPEILLALAARMEGTVRARLGRSLAICVVDAGSCNGCGLEVAALEAPAYDLESHGLRLVGSPRHADVLLVTGPVTRNMTEALRRARACMAEPAWVVSVGDCAADGGCFRGSAAVEDGVGAVLPVDLVIPGCPPAPAQILQGLLALLLAHAQASAPFTER